MSSNIYDSVNKRLIPVAGNSAANAGPLGGLTDVTLTSPTDGQVLKYDATNQEWVNGAGGSVDINSIGDIADVDLDNLQDGQILIYDATNQVWVNGVYNNNTDFVGTQAEWDALTAEQKAAYDMINITDDSTAITNNPGHAISDGINERPQRSTLEFNGFVVTDYSGTDKTQISEIPYTAGDGVDITNKEISVSDEISRTWTGTKAEWDAIVDKSVYDGWIINITDDHASGVGVVVDTVEDGNLNAVTSNAVANVILKPQYSEQSFVGGSRTITAQSTSYLVAAYGRGTSATYVELTIDDNEHPVWSGTVPANASKKEYTPYFYLEIGHSITRTSDFSYESGFTVIPLRP